MLNDVIPESANISLALTAGYAAFHHHRRMDVYGIGNRSPYYIQAALAFFRPLETISSFGAEEKQVDTKAKERIYYAGSDCDTPNTVYFLKCGFLLAILTIVAKYFCAIHFVHSLHTQLPLTIAHNTQVEED